MDRLGVKKAAVGGLSMGGYVAFAFARKFPERVRALVLADTKTGADTPEGKTGRTAFADAVKAGGPGVAVEKLLPKLLAANASPSLKDLVRSSIMKNRAEGIAAALLGMRDRPDSGPTAEKIAVPTLVVCGEKDELTPPADSKAIQAKVKGSQYVELPGVGHLSNMEAPAAFAEAVATFLEGLPDRAEWEPKRHVAAAAATGEGDRD
jgi:pimeloyl-ACP methyl ester carboxylesterase